MGYYQDHTLSVSSVKLFPQNPARALADWTGEMPWFDDSKSNALLLGRAMHSLLEDAVNYLIENHERFRAEADLDSAREQAMTYASDRLKDALAADSDFEPLLTKAGGFRADTKRVFGWAAALWHSIAMNQIIKAAIAGKDYLTVHTEDAFKSEYQGIAYKGKLDCFVKNDRTMTIDAYDYKTARTFDSSGMDWGTDIFGNHRYMPVEWMAEKLFPWQAGVYRQLLRDNGMQDYKIRYHYLTATKQDTPRIDIFEIDDDSMSLGFKQFSRWLVKADAYIKGEEPAPLVMDGSDYANLQSLMHPVKHATVAAEGRDQHASDDTADDAEDFLANLLNGNKKTAS